MDVKILKNPMVLWLRWLMRSYFIKKSNPTIKIGFMTVLTNCEFGHQNIIYENNRLVNVKLGDYSYIGGSSVIKNRFGNTPHALRIYTSSILLFS